MIFPNRPPQQTLLARLREWRTTRRANRRSTTTVGIEHHERMIRGLHAAARPGVTGGPASVTD